MDPWAPMKKILFATMLVSGLAYADGPRFQHKDPITQQEFENVYQVSDRLTSIINNVVLSNDVTPGSSNYIQNTTIPQVDATASPSYINAASSGTIPTLGSVDATITNLTATNAAVSTATWLGFGLLPILQIQSYTTATSSSVTNATFTNTHLSGSFTPKLSTSKILIWVSGDFTQQSGASVGYATIARDGTNLAGSGGFTLTVAGNNFSASMLAYDSPATTSAITYSVQIRTNSGGTAIFPITDGGSFTSTATMLIAEIAQ
jgi:hypothetical protein